MGTAGYSIYCAAKAGVINFAAAMRHELLSKKIAVYVACPADIDTPQFHQEKAAMPSWMTVTDARGKVMSAELCAEKILRRCKGRRFNIIINSDIALLVFIKRLLPESALNFLLDRMFPKPN
jgi:short-subunit dehydrogenase